MISRDAAIRISVIAVLLIMARLAFDLAAAAAYAFPEYDVGQKGIAFVIVMSAVLSALIFAVARLLQKRFVVAGARGHLFASIFI